MTPRPLPRLYFYIGLNASYLTVVPLCFFPMFIRFAVIVFFISISLRHETPKLVDHRDLPNENKVVLHSINQTN